MAKKCAVVGCPNKSWARDQNGATLFECPTKMRQKWMKAINLPNSYPRKVIHVCSDHFKPEDIVRPELHKLSGRTRLRKGVIPSIFCNSNSSNDNSSISNERICSNTSGITVQRLIPLMPKPVAGSDNIGYVFDPVQRRSLGSFISMISPSTQGNSSSQGILLQGIVGIQPTIVTTTSQGIPTTPVSKPRPIHSDSMKMVRRCIVDNCPTVSGESGQSSVSVHACPTPMREKWMAALNKPKSWVPPKEINVCSNHFKPDDFFFNPPGKKVLKAGAVPSVSLPTAVAVEVIALDDVDDDNDNDEEVVKVEKQNLKEAPTKNENPPQGNKVLTAPVYPSITQEQTGVQGPPSQTLTQNQRVAVSEQPQDDAEPPDKRKRPEDSKFPFECLKCKNSFTDSETFENHKKLHELQTPESTTCDICWKRFRDNAFLELHKKLHGEEELVCESCGKDFVSQRSLNAHKKTHEIKNKVSGKKFTKSKPRLLTQKPSKSGVQSAASESKPIDTIGEQSEILITGTASLLEDPSDESPLTMQEDPVAPSHLANGELLRATLLVEALYSKVRVLLKENRELKAIIKKSPFAWRDNIDIVKISESEVDEIILADKDGSFLKILELDQIASLGDITSLDAKGQKRHSCGYCGHLADSQNEMTNHIITHIDGIVDNDACRDDAVMLTGDEIERTGGEDALPGCLDDQTDNCPSPSKCLKSGVSLTNKKKRPPRPFKFFCEPCSFRCRYSSEISRHMLLKHGISSGNEHDAASLENYVCGLCDYVTEKRNNMARHIQRRHVCEKTLRCDECDYKCWEKSSLESHILKIHKKDFTRAPLDMKCTQCSFATTTKVGLRLHMKRIHGVVFQNSSTARNFKCEICDKTFAHRGTFAMHKKSHERVSRNNQDEPEKQFECNVCGRISKTYASYVIHKKSCDKKYSNRIDRIESDGYLEYVCRACGDKFADQESAYGHQCSKPNMLTCHFCDYSTAMKSHYDLHMKTHTGEKPFQCEYCDLSFRQSGHLANHIRTHTGEKPYKCSYCSKRFSEKCNMVVHERIHTGVNPFECAFCDFKGRSKKALNKHIETHYQSDVDSDGPFVIL